MTEAFVPFSPAAIAARPRRTPNWRLVCAVLVNFAVWALIVMLARHFLAR